ncbi:MAG: acyl-CoA dehydrogenase C-terminal domain-containing protein, partial [Acidimicrobiia bacterium]|nr:acyl-CoA dehydrogenase C-terminal domain-containing protein [Acidimicrobiia bacterium]
LLEEMRALDAELAAGGEELLGIRIGLGEGVAALGEASAWLLENHDNTNDVLAGATPYLRMFGVVLGGYLLAKGAVAAHELAKANGDNGWHAAKVTTARFYAEQILPTAWGLLPAVSRGADDLFAVEPSLL